MSLRTLRHWSFLIGVNVAIAAILLAVCEMAARHYDAKIKRGVDLTVQFHPYVMFTTDISEAPKAKWYSYYTKQVVPTDIRVNNLGFVADFDFTYTPSADYLRQYGKQRGEKIILLTGGSAAQGVGATSNEATIAGRMEYYLNQAQQKVRYRVINLAMPSWISYQEFIALDLFGSQFDPDWIVVMDGVNDAATACLLGAGSGNPMFWPAMKYFLHGQSVYSGTTDFLLKHSALFRLILGKKYYGPSALKNLYLDPDEKDPRFKIRDRVTWTAIPEQLAFYTRAQQSILRLYPDAKYTLSTQPIVSLAHARLYVQTFAETNPRQRLIYEDTLKKLLRGVYESQKGQPCVRGSHRFSDTYFMAESALALRQLAAKAETGLRRDVAYLNTIALLPLDEKEREEYFIDLVHLNDRGQDLLGKFYAKNILERDGFTNEAKVL